jgi:hypothetical protein
MQVHANPTGNKLFVTVLTEGNPVSAVPPKWGLAIGGGAAYACMKVKHNAVGTS